MIGMGLLIGGSQVILGQTVIGGGLRYVYSGGHRNLIAQTPVTSPVTPTPVTPVGGGGTGTGSGNTGTPSISVSSLTETKAHVVTITFEVKNYASVDYSSGSSSSMNDYYLVTDTNQAWVPANNFAPWNLYPNFQGYEIFSSDAFISFQCKTSGGGLGKFYLLNCSASTNGTSSVGPTWSQVLEQDYNVLKLVTDVVSVDSRKTYGQPNTDGIYPGIDPNADPRGVNFNGWTYKGGLFVGNMPVGNGDLSGTARMQVYLKNVPTLVQPVWADLVLAYLGSPTAYTADTPITIYVPSATDPNIGAPVANTTWDNAWNLANATAIQSFTITSSTPTMDYLNVQSSTYNPLYLMALTNEPSVISAGTTCWRYFASSSYPPLPSQFTGSDAQPHTWVVDYTYHRP